MSHSWPYPWPYSLSAISGACLAWEREPQLLRTRFLQWTLSPLPVKLPSETGNLQSFWHSPLCGHRSPWLPAASHSHWRCRSSRFHRRWHSDPLLMLGWVLVSGSFQDPLKSLTSLHSWNVWDMALLRRGTRTKIMWWKQTWWTV